MFYPSIRTDEFKIKIYKDTNHKDFIFWSMWLAVFNLNLILLLNSHWHDIICKLKY